MSGEKTAFRDIFGKKLMVFDGSMGTALQAAGLKTGELPEAMNFTSPDTVCAIHRAYIEAGCDVVCTNTFGANRYKLGGVAHGVKETVSEAVKIAKRAVREVACGRSVFVALSVGSVGKLLKPLGSLPFEEAVSAFAEIVTAGAESGADLILFETMSDPYEMKAAVLAAKENCNLPVILTMILDPHARLMSGGDPATACLMLEGMGVDGIGFNCGEGPEQLISAMPALVAASSVPIVCSPNAGLPRVKDGRVSYAVTPDSFASAAATLVAEGACAVGGCCGTDAEYIAKTAAAIKHMPLKKPCEKTFTAVTSRSKAVYFGGEPLIIGERINPTGKPAFKEALRNDDIEYILREGLAQQEKGAHILDVNVGLPGINEPAMLVKAVERLQSVVELPLQLDTVEPTALADALRIYNGKPLINSVNGTEKSMSTVFPLMKKYGAAAVCLAMDDEGISDDPEKRFAVIEKIVARAAEYGISRRDLIADALVTSAATNRDSADITLRAMTLIRERLGIHTVLGISNISFGLPKRDNVNAAFLGLALEAGLSAGIVNPLSEAMMSAYYSSRALGGFRSQYDEYVRTFVPEKAQEKVYSELTLRDAVVSGLSESAAKSVEKLLQTEEPLRIINTQLIPALDEVGKGFESGRLFLPQLLMAAEAAKTAFSAIKASYGSGKSADNSLNSEKSGNNKIIVATVKGDLHDIGKNIVATLLENYGFEVIDLGKNVPPEVIVETAISKGVKLVGLSALMTTTVANMAETIHLLRERVPYCKIMVGGAVLTKDYADSIGADFYGKDAVSSVRYARLIFGE